MYVYFFVSVPPDILNEVTSGDMSVSEGENTTLSCKAAGHPTPRIIWRREDGHPILIRKGLRDYAKVEVYNGTNMHFWRLDRRQMGAYLCIASNDIPPAVSKRISLSVNCEYSISSVLPILWPSLSDFKPLPWRNYRISDDWSLLSLKYKVIAN
ncbi:hypothetical protein JTB14_029124 [Gonioctena quinquepunctata]|nr:hypothetical protein JTB14_029124 [Gonioctena quinquepunctata]